MRRAPGGHLQDVAPGSAHHPPSHELDAGEELVPLDLLVEPIGEAVVRLASHRLVHDGAARGDAGAVADCATIDAPPFPPSQCGQGLGAAPSIVPYPTAVPMSAAAARRNAPAAPRTRRIARGRVTRRGPKRVCNDDDCSTTTPKSHQRAARSTFGCAPALSRTARRLDRNVRRRSTETGGARARRRTARGRRPRLRRVSRFPRGVRVASTSSRGVGANDGEDDVGLSGRVRGGSIGPRCRRPRRRGAPPPRDGRRFPR